MLVLKVKYTAKPGMRRAFRDAVEREKIDAASRGEEGCLLYEYTEPDGRPNELMLDEVWEDAESQKMHCATAHFRRLGELKEQYVESTQLDRYDLDLETMQMSLARRGYIVSIFDTAEEAAEYLDNRIDGKNVGIGGSVTLDKMGMYQRLSAHNNVEWHWHLKEDETVQEARTAAMTGDVYLSSVNGISEAGEIVNIDGAGNRLAGTLFGHGKVYYVLGINKIRPTLEDAIGRARNTAAPLNAKRLECETPCEKRGVCYDCQGADRICRAMTITYAPMMGQETEVVIIKKFLGL